MLKAIKYLFFCTIILMAQASDCQNIISIENLNSKLKERDNRKDEHYFLDSLMANTAENSSLYFAAILAKSEILRTENQKVKSLNELKKISENEIAGAFPEILAKTYLNLSSIYAEQGSIEFAKTYLTEAFIIFDSLDNLELKALTLIKTADLEQKSENYNAAIRHLKQAHDIYLESGKIYPSIEIAQKIGAIAYQAGEFLEAEKYLKLAFSGRKETNNKSEQIKILETLVSIYKFEDRLDEAVASQNDLIQISSESGNLKLKASFLEELSKTYFKQNRFRDALKTQEEASSLLSNENDLDYYKSLLKLSELYKIQNRETDAILTLHEANSLAQQLGDKSSIISSSKIISDFYKNRGQWEEAHTYLALSDSIKNSLLEKKIRILENDKSIEKETNVINEAEQSGILNSNYQQKAIYFTGLCISLLFIIILLFISYRKKKKTRKLLEWKVFKRTEELRSVNEELNTYIYKSSHDLRNPLTSIKSLITLLKGKQDEEQRLKYVDLIENCAIQMDEILLNLSRAVDYKKVDVNIEQINFINLKEELSQSLIRKELSGIDLSWEIREKAPFFSDPKLIKVILKKTILNSLQYRLGSSNDFCKISIITDRTGASVLVEDNGQGIAEKVKDSVFEMFVKGTHKSKGAGLGLYLVKIAADKLKGKITLESEENKGAKLVFNLPNLS